jgi:hypothetical protein
LAKRLKEGMSKWGFSFLFELFALKYKTCWYKNTGKEIKRGNEQEGFLLELLALKY